MSALSLRPMRPEDRIEVAELICVSTNFWYQKRGNPPIFPGGPESTVVFFDVYEALDPGCGVVAKRAVSGVSRPSSAADQNTATSAEA